MNLIYIFNYIPSQNLRQYFGENGQMDHCPKFYMESQAFKKPKVQIGK